MSGHLRPARPFVPGDALRLRFVSEAGFIPHGPLGYYCVSAVDIESTSELLSLWLFDRRKGAPRQVTGEFANPRAACSSADGAHLAFIADVDGLAQLWSFAVGTGALDMLTALPQGVSGAPAWSPNGELLAFTAPPQMPRDPSVPYRVDRATTRYEGIGVIDDAVRDIYLLRVATGAVSRLTSDRSINQDPRWSPDGKSVLFRASFVPDEEWTGKPSACVIEVASGERRVVVRDWGGVSAAEWCPRGDGLVFAGVEAAPGTADAYKRKQDLWTVDAMGGTPVCRTENLAAGIGVWLEFDHPTCLTYHQPRIRLDASGETAYVSAQRGCDVGICMVSLVGDEDVDFAVAPKNRTCFLQDVDAADRALLYVSSTLVDPAELFLRDSAGDRRVTKLNDEVTQGLIQPDVTELEITAPDGLRIEGWALTPPGEGPFPAVLCIHGGPFDAYGSIFMADWHLLVGAGFAVVFSNFRGSGGYGNEFHQALQGRWGEIGEPDHLATIDHAIEIGVADPELLGVYGLSHGGFATCWLAGRTRHFHRGHRRKPRRQLHIGVRDDGRSLVGPARAWRKTGRRSGDLREVISVDARRAMHNSPAFHCRRRRSQVRSIRVRAVLPRPQEQGPSYGDAAASELQPPRLLGGSRRSSRCPKRGVDRVVLALPACGAEWWRRGPVELDAPAARTRMLNVASVGLSTSTTSPPDPCPVWVTGS